MKLQLAHSIGPFPFWCDTANETKGAFKFTCINRDHKTHHRTRMLYSYSRMSQITFRDNCDLTHFGMLAKDWSVIILCGPFVNILYLRKCKVGRKASNARIVSLLMAKHLWHTAIVMWVTLWIFRGKRMIFAYLFLQQKLCDCRARPQDGFCCQSFGHLPQCNPLPIPHPSFMNTCLKRTGPVPYEGPYFKVCDCLN